MDRLLVAFRYLLARPISYVSLLGVLVGLGALVLVDSVMNGFLGLQRDIARSSTPDLAIAIPAELRADEEGLERLRQAVASVEGVQNAALRQSWPAIFRPTSGRVDTHATRELGLDHFVNLVGLDEGREAELLGRLLGRESSALPLRRTPRLIPLRPEDPFWFDVEDPYWVSRVQEDQRDYPLTPVLFGELLALRMNLSIGDVLAMGSFGEQQVDGSYASRNGYFVVVGSFRLADQEMERTHALVPRDGLVQFLGVPERARELAVDVPGDPDLVRDRVVQAVAPFGVAAADVRTWEEIKSELLHAIENERSFMNFVLFFLIVIAGFNLFVSLSMMVQEKVREVGVLISMGAGANRVAGIFMTCGLLVTVVGSVLGLTGGLLLTVYINPAQDLLERLTGLTVFGEDLFAMAGIPTQIEFGRIAAFTLATMLCTLLFTWLPARRAGRMEVVDALRRE